MPNFLLVTLMELWMMRRLGIVEQGQEALLQPQLWCKIMYSKNNQTLYNKAHLDRAMASAEWGMVFSNSSVRTLVDCISDYAPILLNTTGITSIGYKPFQFEAIWAKDVWSHWVVQRAWNSVNHHSYGKSVVKRIAKTRFAHHKWNKDQFGNVQTTILEAQRKLEVTQSLPPISRKLD